MNCLVQALALQDEGDPGSLHGALYVTWNPERFESQRMLSVTEEAGDFLIRTLEDRGAVPGQAVRLVQTDTGVDLVLDTPDEDDGKFSHEDRLVLIVDRDTLGLLAGTKLDVEQAEGQEWLTLFQGENPCAAEDCSSCEGPSDSSE